MAALVEVHKEEELRRALEIRPRIVGVNNRDLGSFQVDPNTTIRLRRLVPRETILVSESGIKSREDVLRMQEAGIDAVLVGEALMRHEDPGAAARRLLGNG